MPLHLRVCVVLVVVHGIVVRDHVRRRRVRVLKKTHCSVSKPVMIYGNSSANVHVTNPVVFVV